MASKPFIGIVDYGMGNLMSVSRAFGTLGYGVKITDNVRHLGEAGGMVLPGVGAFRDCMDNLDKRGLIGFIIDWINSGKPFLGICLGLQILFTESYEFGVHRGLDIFQGSVVRFADDMMSTFYAGGVKKEKALKIPHMGWNRVAHPAESRFFAGLPPGSYFYFVHSFYVVPDDEKGTCKTEYGIEFVSGISKNNVLAVQFHPEKSQKVGLALLDNFGRYVLQESNRRT